jgi:hypothetical protein
LRAVDQDLPEELRRLLPAGQYVASEEGEPAFWMSDEPVRPGLWSHVRDLRAGFWPLLLGPEDDEGAPWTTGEAFSNFGKTAPDDHDPETVLRGWWRQYTKNAGRDALAPFGRKWPKRPAPTPPNRVDPDECADALADRLLTGHPSMRLGLVAAGSGSEALAVSGWDGPVNYVGDTGMIAAVVRAWERRHGARVVALDGFATLHLSVAAPPANHDEALRVAVEHFAFCPDNIWQGAADDSLITYARRLIGADHWVFWWD